MCLMAPARVTAVGLDECHVELGGRLERASTLLSDVADLGVGDWVLVNGGIVVRRLDPEQAQAMSEAVSIVFGVAPATATEPRAAATDPRARATDPGAGATYPRAMEIES